MGSGSIQKLKLLYIVDILKQHTDENNVLDATDICEMLAERGISAERKAIYNDIEMLLTYGYDIVLSKEKGRRGYFLASREFEKSEIYLLCDAVRSADFISPKKTRELVSKLSGMLSLSQAKKTAGFYIDSKNKCNNEEIYYNIDAVNEAIVNHKKINLKYYRHILEDGKQIKYSEKSRLISPYALIWQDDRYYLVGNYEKYDNLIHLRLDRMKKVEITDMPARPFSEVSEYSDTFDVSDYTAKAFNMFGGKLKKIELRCKKEKLEQIIDRFSDKIFIFGLTDTTFSFSADAMISDGLIGWILQFGTDIEVVKPLELRNTIKEKLKELNEMYK